MRLTLCLLNDKTAGLTISGRFAILISCLCFCTTPKSPKGGLYCTTKSPPLGDLGVVKADLKFLLDGIYNSAK